MNEEIFISGRDIPKIDPVLEVWHYPIAIDFFVGGLAAGILLFSAIIYLLKKEDDYPAASKWATLVPPIAISIALIALFIDLSHKLYFWRLYTTIRFSSPMSWGSWVLLFLTPLSFLWAFVNLRAVFPKLNYDKFPLLYKIEDFVVKYKKPIAIALIPLALALGTYPGIMIAAFNARPLWNNVMMGPLFMVYGITTGIATILLLAKTAKEIKLLNKILVFMIVILLSLILNFIMGYYAGNEMQLEAIDIFMGGELTTSFWGFVIVLGLLIPLFLALLSLFEIKIPLKVVAILILIGGLIFRIIIVDAGQITRILY